MATERRSGSINVPSIHGTPLVLAGLLVAGFTAGAVVTSALTTGRLLVPGDTGAAVTETSPIPFDGLTAEQRAVDFRLSEKGLPTQSELTAEQRAVDFRLSEKGLPTQSELTAEERAVDFRLSEKGLPTQFEPGVDMSAAAYAATHDATIGAPALDGLDMSSAAYGATHPTGTDMDAAAYDAMHQH